MSSASDKFQAFLQQQRREYRESLPQRRAQLEAAWQQALDGAPAGRTALERNAHTLAGSGATFGFAALGAAARALEEAVAAPEEAVAAPEAAPVAALAPLYAAVLEQMELAGEPAA